MWGSFMGFEKNNSIRKVLKDTEDSSMKFEEFERTKQYQFTLQPSVREKINKLAKDNGFRSASSFINDYFKKL